MGHSTENPFVKPTVAICSGHKQVSSLVFRESRDLIGARTHQSLFGPSFGSHLVSRQIQHNVIDLLARALLLIAFVDFDDRNALRLV